MVIICRFRQPLHLSTFTLDEFEHAIRHSVIDPPCALLAEVHSTLIYNLRTVPFTRHSAVLSLLRLKEQMEVDGAPDEEFDVSIEQLSAAMADVGNNWERVPLRHSEGREGWEDALLGCLKDVSNEGSLALARVDPFFVYSMQPSTTSRSFVKSLPAFSLPPMRRRSLHRLQAVPGCLHQRLLLLPHLLRLVNDIIHYLLKIGFPSCPSCVIWRYPAKRFIRIWSRAKSS
jgi:hypothetical protein